MNFLYWAMVIGFGVLTLFFPELIAPELIEAGLLILPLFFDK